MKELGQRAIRFILLMSLLAGCTVLETTPTSTSIVTPIPTDTPTNTPIPTSTPTPTSGDTGWLSPSANMAETTGDGDGFEQDAVHAHADDDQFATDTNSGNHKKVGCDSPKKDGHRFFNFGVELPVDVNIQGIEIRVDAMADDTAGSPYMCVQLSGDGGSSWTPAQTTPILTTAESTFLLGGPDDNWGQAWSLNQLSDANLRLRLVNVASDISRDFSLDWVAVKVHYSGAGQEPTPTPTNTPAGTPTPSATPTSTPTPAGTPALHIADLDGSSTSQGSTWTAKVNIMVTNSGGAAAADSTINGTWSDGASGPSACTTDASGWCTVSHSSISKGRKSVSFTVDDVTHATLVFDPTANVDPDGDSNGTAIMVQKP